MSRTTELLSGLTASRCVARRAGAAALAAAFVLGSANAAFAQRYGETQFPMDADGGTRRFPAVAYDGASNSYLVAWGVIQLGARFVSSEGIPLGAPVPLNTDGVSRQAGAVRVACGANVNVCLITWLEETPTRIVGRLVRNNGGNVQFLSDRFPISDTGTAKLSSSAPTVTYSPVATEFLVSWTETNVNVYAQRVTAGGVPVGAVIPIAITGMWEGLPSATYNSALDEYFVAFYFEPGTDAVGGVRVKPGTGEVVGHNPATGNVTLYSGIFEKYPEVAYNSAANEYLAITWGPNFTLHGQRVSAAGQPVGGILPLALGGGDGIGIGYSRVANAYLATYQHPNLGEAWASLLASDGTPGTQFAGTATGGANARQPQAAGSSQAARFLLVSTYQYAAVMSQMVQSGLGGPPPPPPPPTCTFTLSMPGWSFGAPGGSGGVLLTASDSTCTWTGTSSAGWLTLGGGDTSGTGSRAITYTVAPNTSGSPRSATLTVGGQVFSVSQAPAATLRAWAHDMTGDGLSDLLWFNVATSQASIWQMSGPNVVATPWVNGGAPVAAGWTPSGTGDLNADGIADIIWRHEGGALSAWLMQGTTPIDTRFLTFLSTGGIAVQPDLGWQIRAVGDVDGDGSADLVWQHTNGELSLWRMQAFTVVETVGLSVGALSDPNWQMVGGGDIDHDGKADLVFQHIPSGFMTAWLMDGRQIRSSSYLSVYSSDPAWFAKGVGDVNGDGYADIIWQHADGRLSVWYLNGFNVIHWGLLSIPAVVNTNWRLIGPG